MVPLRGENGGADLIERVADLPEETTSMQGGMVYVGGEPLRGASAGRL
nr:hypothetical protein [Rubrobacter aplysinae]